MLSAEELWSLKMDQTLVWISVMNNSSSSTEPGEDCKSAQMKNFGRESQKEILLNNSQLHIGPILWIERTTIWVHLLDQIHSPGHLVSPKQLIRPRLLVDSTVTLILSKKSRETASESPPVQISTYKIHTSRRTSKWLTLLILEPELSKLARINRPPMVWELSESPLEDSITIKMVSLIQLNSNMASDNLALNSMKRSLQSFLKTLILRESVKCPWTRFYISSEMVTSAKLEKMLFAQPTTILKVTNHKLLSRTWHHNMTLVSIQRSSTTLRPNSKSWMSSSPPGIVKAEVPR